MAGVMEILLLILLLLAVIVGFVSAIMGSRKDKAKRSQRSDNYEQWRQQTARGEEVSEETRKSVKEYDPETLMAHLRRDMRLKLITQEEFQRRRAEIWRMEEERKAAQEQAAAQREEEKAATVEEKEERERQLQKIRQQLDAGLINKAEYEEKRKDIN